MDEIAPKDFGALFAIGPCILCSFKAARSKGRGARAACGRKPAFPGGRVFRPPLGAKGGCRQSARPAAQRLLYYNIFGSNAKTLTTLRGAQRLDGIYRNAVIALHRGNAIGRRIAPAAAQRFR